jgi:hypothetical protein
MKRLWKITAMEWRLINREFITLFFALIFPVLMLLLFGTIYGNQPNTYLIEPLINMVFMNNFPTLIYNTHTKTTPYRVDKGVGASLKNITIYHTTATAKFNTQYLEILTSKNMMLPWKISPLLARVAK